jgi:hypothetical protein
MTENHIGTVTFEIDAGALRQIIASGRLAEFAGKAGAHAASQINAQVVDLVSQAAIDQGAVSDGLSVKFSTVFEGGDFGTVPHGPRPHFGVVFGETGLSQVVAVATLADRET